MRISFFDFGCYKDKFNKAQNTFHLMHNWKATPDFSHKFKKKNCHTFG